MLKKMLVGFSLFLFSIIAFAEPLTYPFKFEELKKAVGSKAAVEMVIPKFNDIQHQQRYLEAFRHDQRTVPDNAELSFVRLYLQISKPNSVIINGDPATKNYVKFHSGYGILNEVSMVYNFSDEATKDIALEKMAETKAAFIENLKREGYSHSMFFFGDMVKGDSRVSFSTVNYMRSQVLYVNITDDKVTAFYEDIESTALKVGNDKIKNEVATAFR